MEKDSLLTQPEELTEQAKQFELAKTIQEKVKTAVALVGNEGRYQVVMLVYFCICYFFAVYFWTSPSYLFMNPKFICNGETTSQINACGQLEHCTLENDFTITTKVGLYCDQKNQRNAIQAMMGIGGIVTAVMSNFLSDFQGRKFSYMLATSLGIFSGAFAVIGAYTGSFILLLLSQLLAGIAVFGQIYLYFVILDRVMSKRWYDRSVFILNGSYGIGQISVLLFTIGLTWWHYTVIFELIGSVCMLIFGFFFVVQDPVLLFNKRRYQECKKCLTIIAKVNNTTDRLSQAINIIQDMKTEYHGQNSIRHKQSGGNNKLAYLKVFKDCKNVLLPLILLCSLNFGNNMSYYAISLAASQVGISFGIDMVMFGAATILGCLPLLFCSTTVPRKMGLIVVVAMQIVLGGLFLLKMPVIVQTLDIAIINLLVVPRFSLFMVHIIERFTPQIHSSVIGIIQVFGKASASLAPIAVRLSDDLSINPVLTVSVIQLLLSLIPLLFIKQTVNQSRLRNESQKSEQVSLVQ